MSTPSTPRASRSRKSGDPVADRAKADAKDQAAAAKLQGQAEADQAAEVQVRDITDETPEQAKARKAAAKIRDTATRATWKAHGNPSRFTYYGNGSAPAETGIPAVVLSTDKQGISLDTSDGDPLARFGLASKFWAIVPADAKAPAKAKADPKPAKAPTGDRAAKIAALAHLAPAGYAVLWPHASHSLLKADGSAPEGGTAPESPWLVLCNAHGTTTTATNARDGETKGTKAQRLTWCRQCKADEAKAAKDQAKAQAKADQAKDDADSPATKAAADRILAGDSTLADEITAIVG